MVRREYRERDVERKDLGKAEDMGRGGRNRKRWVKSCQQLTSELLKALGDSIWKTIPST